MNWNAVNQEPVAKPKDIESIEYPGDARTLSKKAKAQLDAAKKAAKSVLPEFDGPVNVSLSGYAAGKDDSDPDQIYVVVARA